MDKDAYTAGWEDAENHLKGYRDHEIRRLRAELAEVASRLTEAACDCTWFERRPCRFCSRSLVCYQCALCCGCEVP